MTLACIGAAHVDRTARALGPVAMGSSNPVEIATSVGGVAGNVARVAARLGADVRFIGLVGDDAAGLAVRRALGADGVVTDGLVALAGGVTASYTAFLDGQGELVVALADMALYDRFDAGLIDAAGPALAEATLWFADANLPGRTLAHLARIKPPGTRLFADAVSVAKAPRLAGLVLDGLFLNRDEARALHPGTSAAKIVAEARAAGRAMVLSFGADGGIVLDADGRLTALDAAPAAPRDATGAGDAMVGAALAALAGGETDLVAAVIQGLVAAAFALEADGSLPGAFDSDLLAARLAETPSLLRAGGQEAMQRLSQLLDA